MLAALFRNANAARDADVYALTILTAVRTGSEAKLGAYLRGLNRRDSPFRRMRSTHFARLVVVDELAGLEEDRQQYLLFSAVIDGTTKLDRDNYLLELCDRMPDEVDGIWGCCAGIASSKVPEDFAATMAAHELKTRAFYTDYDATVQEVRDALEVHREVRDVAARLQYLTADKLRRFVKQRLDYWRR